jgi:hypothetical protein
MLANRSNASMNVICNSLSHSETGEGTSGGLRSSSDVCHHGHAEKQWMRGLARIRADEAVGEGVDAFIQRKVEIECACLLARRLKE